MRGIMQMELSFENLPPTWTCPRMIYSAAEEGRPRRVMLGPIR
jgi:hypothetical protein